MGSDCDAADEYGPVVSAPRDGCTAWDAVPRQMQSLMLLIFGTCKFRHDAADLCQIASDRVVVSVICAMGL